MHKLYGDATWDLIDTASLLRNDDYYTIKELLWLARWWNSSNGVEGVKNYKEKKYLQEGMQLTREMVLAGKKQCFPLSHSKWLRTKEKDLMPTTSLEQVIIKCCMLVEPGYGSSPESVIVTKRTQKEYRCMKSYPGLKKHSWNLTKRVQKLQPAFQSIYVPLTSFPEGHASHRRSEGIRHLLGHLSHWTVRVKWTHVWTRLIEDKG